jgi:tetratricopeptide (TPR) repeat protein
MVLLYQNQTAEAVQRFEESLAISREIGDRWSAAAALNNLGGLALAQQYYDQAADFLGDSLALFREIGDRGAIAQTLTNLGHVAFALDDPPLATARYHEALQLAKDMGAVPLILEIIAGVARLRAKAQQVESALELIGLALSHPGTNNDAKAVAEPLLTELRAKLPADAVEKALERGKAGDLDGIVAAVLADMAKQSDEVTTV